MPLRVKTLGAFYSQLSIKVMNERQRLTREYYLYIGNIMYVDGTVNKSNIINQLVSELNITHCLTSSKVYANLIYNKVMNRLK